MQQLVTPDDLDEGSATSLVRLAVQLHDAEPSVSGLRVDGPVALVLAGRASSSTKLRLQAAIERLGAEVVRCRVTPAGLAPLPGHADRGIDLRSPVACVVFGMRAAAVAAVAEQAGIPTFNAGADFGDPWAVLADQVAQELTAGSVPRRAVDAAEMRREALVPTAAAIIATIAGAVAEPSVDEPAHWFG